MTQNSAGSRSKSELRTDLEECIRQLLELNPPISEYRHPLMEVSFDSVEIIEAIDSLLDRRLTMGPKVQAFEEAFADWAGTKHAIMVNSGSSANLLAVSSLLEHRGEKGPVLTPAVTWSTTVFPLTQHGLTPMFLDVNPTDFTTDLEGVPERLPEDAAGFMAVHLLGAPSPVDDMKRIADENGMFLIEDCCEAMGTTVGKTRAGTVGDVGTFSFFFSHHITTGEGGMLVTDDDALADTIRSKRAHGWVREREDREAVGRNNPGIDERYLFVTDGYNLRPTELSGAFGLHQLPRLDSFLEARRENAAEWMKVVNEIDYLRPLKGSSKGSHGWFALPMVLTDDSPLDTQGVSNDLEDRGVETRPIMAGNMIDQPAMQQLPHDALSDLEGARTIADRGLMIGNPPTADSETIREIGQILRNR